MSKFEQNLLRGIIAGLKLTFGYITTAQCGAQFEGGKFIIVISQTSQDQSGKRTNDVYSSESTIWINDFFSPMNNSLEWKTTN